MSIQTIIFDWDGTLGMTSHLWLAGYHEAMQNQGHSYSDKVIARNFFYEHDKSKKKYPHIEFQRLLSDAYAHIHQHLPGLALFTGAEKTLEALGQKGIALGLVSSSPQALLQRGLAVHDLEKHFSSIIAGDDDFAHKPDPATFNETMQRLGARPENTLMIGDALSDIRAGQAAKIKTCAFTPQENLLFHDFEALAAAGPDFGITTLESLVDLV